MKVEGDGKLLRIFIGESDRHRGQPLFEAIIRKAHELGLAGATAWQGIEGFGAHSRIHTAKILRLSEDLPIIVEIVDTEDKIRALLPQIDAMMQSAGSSGLITMESVQVFKYE